MWLNSEQALIKAAVIKEGSLKVLCCQSCHLPLPQVGTRLTTSVIVAPAVRKSSARFCPVYSNNSEIRSSKETITKKTNSTNQTYL